MALDLLKDDMNNIRVELFKKANGHQQEVEDDPEKVHLFLKNFIMVSFFFSKKLWIATNGNIKHLIDMCINLIFMQGSIHHGQEKGSFLEIC